MHGAAIAGWMFAEHTMKFSNSGVASRGKQDARPHLPRSSPSFDRHPGKCGISHSVKCQRDGKNRFYQEIRWSIDRMNELVSSLLECSMDRDTLSARCTKHR